MITDNRILQLIPICMLFLTIKLIANFWFFRVFHLDLFNWHLKVSGSALLITGAFVLLDFSSKKFGSKVGVLMLIVGIVCDGFFSYGINFIANLPHSGSYNQFEQQNNILLQLLADRVVRLYNHEVFAAIISYSVELFLFNYLSKYISSFSLASFIAIFLIKSIHTILVVSGTLHGQSDVMQLIAGNILANTFFSIVYIGLINLYNQYIPYLFKTEK